MELMHRLEYSKLMEETRQRIFKEITENTLTGNKTGVLDELKASHYSELISFRYAKACLLESMNRMDAGTCIKFFINNVEGGLYESECWKNLNKLFIYMYEGFNAWNIKPLRLRLLQENLKHLTIRDRTPTGFFDDCKTGYHLKGPEKQVNKLTSEYKELYCYNDYELNPIFINLLTVYYYYNGI